MASSSSDEEVVSDEDWEGGTVGLGAARRTKRRREDAIYGVFGEDESEEDEARGRRGKKRQGGGKREQRAAYAAPVEFVRAEPDDSVATPGLGAGNANAAPDVLKKHQERREEEEEPAHAPETAASAFGRRVLDGARRRREQEENAELNRRRQQEGKPAPPRRMNDTQQLGVAEAATLARLEKTESKWHGKGIGLKLLSKMGFKGSIGGSADGTSRGVTAPIVTVMRPKSMGMGYNEFKEAGQLNRTAPPAGGSHSAASAAASARPAGAVGSQPPATMTTKSAVARRDAWKKGKAKKPKREYKSAQELVREMNEAKADERGAGETPAATTNHDASKVVIVDMTSKHGARGVTDLSQLKSQAYVDDADDGKVPLPELQHNVRLLTTQAQAKLIELEGKTRRTKESLKLLQMNNERLIDKHNANVESAREAKWVLESAETALKRWAPPFAGADGSANGTVGANAKQEDETPMTRIDAALSELEDTMAALHGAPKFRHYGLPTVAYTICYPLAQAAFEGWSPQLADQRPYVAMMRRVNALLCDDEALFIGILEVSILPTLRKYVVNEWHPESPEPLLSVIERWAMLLPDGVTMDVYSTLVIPRLAKAVEEWKYSDAAARETTKGDVSSGAAAPRRSSSSMHLWLHPWLPMFLQSSDYDAEGARYIDDDDHAADPMGMRHMRLEQMHQQTSELLSLVRRRLTKLLDDDIGWHPSDRTTIATIIMPWAAPTLPSQEWMKIINKSILPKLANTLAEELVITPTNQDMKAFHDVMAYCAHGTSNGTNSGYAAQEDSINLLPTHTVAKLLDQNFFPAWQATLDAWLRGNGGDGDDAAAARRRSDSRRLDDIAAWYMAWKGLIPEAVQSELSVRKRLARALDAMNAAANDVLGDE